MCEDVEMLLTHAEPSVIGYGVDEAVLATAWSHHVVIDPTRAGVKPLL